MFWFVITPFQANYWLYFKHQLKRREFLWSSPSLMSVDIRGEWLPSSMFFFHHCTRQIGSKRCMHLLNAICRARIMSQSESEIIIVRSSGKQSKTVSRGNERGRERYSTCPTNGMSLSRNGPIGSIVVLESHDMSGESAEKSAVMSGDLSGAHVLRFVGPCKSTFTDASILLHLPA